MASQHQAPKLAHARARRAANNNYRRLIKTLCSKLEKISDVYDANVYFVAQRNGRIIECVSADATGREPWLPPDRAALNRYYPPPTTKLLVQEEKASRRRDKRLSSVGRVYTSDPKPAMLDNR